MQWLLWLGAEEQSFCLQTPCSVTSNRADPPAPLQVPHPSSAFNTTHEKFYLQVIVVTSSSSSIIQVRVAQQTGTDT